MAEKIWAVQYTDESYLTKAEVSQAMGTSLIDGYWNDIIEYRKKGLVSLPFRSITNTPFYLAGANPAIRGKIEAFEAKESHFLDMMKKMVDPKLEEQAQRVCLLACLKAVNSIENAQMSELSLKALLNGTYQENNPFHKPILDYSDALKSCLNGSLNVRLSDDFVGEALAKCLGVSELTSFYRTFDFDNSIKRVEHMYNADYAYAPFGFIETLMGEFSTFLRSSSVSPFLKAAMALYYFDYIKPFEKMNDEMGSLVAKAVLYSSLGSEAMLLPYEVCLLKNPRFKTYALEAQRTGDLTYLTLYFISVLEPLLDSLSEDIKAIRIEPFRKEFETLSPEEKAAAPVAPSAPKKTEQLSIFPNEEPTVVAVEKPAPAPAKPVEQPKPAPEVTPVATPTPVVEEKVAPKPVEAPAPKVEAVTPIPKIAPEEMGEGTGEVSLSKPENALSEKEVKEYVQYLLETNPSLNKNQASFLANHCTLGRYYTIQQFKKFTRCAYETARTSMDKLANEHYYEKKQVKNKFVYTPLRKGDSSHE
jgi:Fic family protein